MNGLGHLYKDDDMTALAFCCCFFYQCLKPLKNIPAFFSNQMLLSLVGWQMDMKGKSWEIFGPHKIPNNKVGCKKVSFSLLEIVSPCIPQNPQYKKASENAYVLLTENWFHKEKSFDKDSSREPKSFCTNQCSLHKIQMFSNTS